MIQQRELTKEELEKLLIEAPLSETKFLRDNNIANFEFFKSGVACQGLVINDNPVYIAMIRQGIFWTVVNKDVKEKITLCKYAKKQLLKWVYIFGKLTATMHKDNKENMKWVEWLGFKKIYEDTNIVTYMIGA